MSSYKKLQIIRLIANFILCILDLKRFFVFSIIIIYLYITVVMYISCAVFLVIN